jgi:hypothetical protein
MNANDISPKINPRMNRIKIVSRIFRTLIGIIAVLMALMSALFVLVSIKYLLDGGQPMPGVLQIGFSPHQCYIFPFYVPLPVFLVGATRFCLAGIGLILLSRLFLLYERGDFFKTGNIRCFKFFGLIVIGLWLSQMILELMAHHNNLNGNGPVEKGLIIIIGPYRADLAMFFGLVYGVLIVFIAWIMDEGRKIQEEQELTV